MPRRRIADANKLGNKKPSRRAATQIDEPELAKRRRAIANLVMYNRPLDEVRAAMQKEFPGISTHTIDSMWHAGKRAYIDQTPEVLAEVRSKQEARIYGHIGAARAKGQFGAVAQFEKLLVDIKGTAAPRRIIIQSDAATKEKLAAVLVMLPQAVLADLVGGRFVPLGFSSVAPRQLIEAEGTSDDDD
jgi:hypothetical protein